MILSKTLTETLPLKNPKTLKLYAQTWYVNEKFLVMITYYTSFKTSSNVELHDIIFKHIN